MIGCTIFRGETFSPRKGSDIGIVPWAETLRRAGYKTWHVGKWHNAGTPRDWGYEETRGIYASSRTKPADPGKDFHGRKVTGYTGYVFKTDDGQIEIEKGIGLTPDISSYFADAAIELIDRKPAEPFFLHVNFTAPHDPLLWPTEFQTRYRAGDMQVPPNFLPEHPFDHGNLRGRDELLFAWPRTHEEVRDELACYYAVIAHLDQQVGRILDALDRTGQTENTIVIYSSDQGLGVGSHGLRGKQNMYEHTIDVPLIVRGPDVRAGVRSDAQVYLRDLYPTTCEAAGVTPPSSIEGRSFWPILEGRAQEGYPFVVGYFRDTQRMIRTDRWKLVEYPQVQRTQFFDLATDPDELHDLSNDPAQEPTIAKLHEQLHTWLREHGDPLEAR
jgi:arylsulfatase A-like enzyme